MHEYIHLQSSHTAITHTPHQRQCGPSHITGSSGGHPGDPLIRGALKALHFHAFIYSSDRDPLHCTRSQEADGLLPTLTSGSPD